MGRWNGCYHGLSFLGHVIKVYDVECVLAWKLDEIKNLVIVRSKVLFCYYYSLLWELLYLFHVSKSSYQQFLGRITDVQLKDYYAWSHMLFWVTWLFVEYKLSATCRNETESCHETVLAWFMFDSNSSSNITWVGI